MGDDRLDLAEALLAKARSTTFEAERDSFVAGAYSQLSSFLDSAPVSLPRSTRARRPSPGVVGAVQPRALPALSDPALCDPAASEPALSEPALCDPAASEPALSEPALSEPVEDLTTPVPIVDLTALEAYQATTACPDRRGVLIDLAI